MDEMTPTPKISLGMTFPKAMEKVIEGKLIKRLEWKEFSYGLLKDEMLQIYTNGKFNNWFVSDGDLMAEDWTVVEQVN